MIASFHVLALRKRLLPPHGRPTRSDGVRYWTALFTGRDPFLAMPPHISGLRLLQPNLREWAYFGVWDSEAHLNHFLASAPLAKAWRQHTTQTLSIWLQPTYTRGDWPGFEALHGHEERELPQAPTALMTRLDLPPTALPAFWLSAAPKIAAHMPAVPGLMFALPVTQRPYTQPMTFTIWRSLDDAMAFAYSGTPHQTAIGRLQQAYPDIVTRFSRARFYPFRSAGSWRGTNPLEACVASPAS